MRKKLLILFLFFYSFIFSQEKKELSFDNVELTIALAKIESAFNIKFSYNSDIVENKHFSFSQLSTLEEVLFAIELQTNITSEKINNRYYILKKKDSFLICGYIKNISSNEPIEGASILNTSKKAGTSSNSEGYFELLINEEEIIEVSFLGYETQNFPSNYFNTNKCKDIYLIEDTFDIQEVIISEYLTTGITKNKDGSITIIPKGLGILPGLTEPDILQNIQVLPGVKSPNETASELFIRGGTPDQNLILFDGIKMYYSGHFFGMISAFNPYIVKDINFYKGGAKARFGNRISGVIDISTKENNTNEVKGGFGFNLTHADAYLNTKITDKLGVVISARRSITDAIETKTFDKFSKKVFQNTKISNGNRVFEEDVVTNVKDLFYFNDYYVKLKYNPSEKDEFSFSNISVKNKLEYEFLIEEFDELSNDKLNINNTGFNFLWNHKTSSNFSYNISSYYSDFNLDYEGTNLYIDEVQNKTIKKNTVKDFYLGVQAKWKLSDFKNLSFGYQFSNNKVGYTLGYENVFFENDNFNDVVSETNNTHTLYSEYEINEDKWYLSLGARTNYYSILDKLYFEPRIEVQRKINPRLNLNFSVEQNRQTLSKIIEFNTSSFGLENEIWVLANKKDKSILKSHQFSTGLNYRKNNWNIDFEGYYKKIEGLTSLTNGFTTSTNNYSEGESEIVGLDILIKKKINNYRTFMSYSLTNNKSTFSAINNGNSFRGNQDIRNSFSWSHSYKMKDFDFSLGWTIRTGIPYTNAEGLTTNDENNTVINYEKVNAERLPNYHRLDFSAYYKFQFTKSEKWKGKFGLSVLNIYDKQNILNRDYDIRFDDNGVETLQILDRYSLGITPNLVFRVEF